MAYTCWQFDLLSWPCLTQAEWAAWFQAISSVVAIIVALAIPAFQWRMARREKARDDEAVTAATAAQMLPHIQDIGRTLTQIINGEGPKLGSTPSGPIGPEASALINHKSVDILSASLRSLGPVRNTASKVVFNIYRAREIVETNGSTVETWSNRKFYGRLQAAQTATAQTLDQIDKLFSDHIGDM
ncbi:hypothetical protein STPYR_10370 [uncultured Stenotrophomonas sp.]|uniref:Transmembrane protein n=1 Tax=uncultured Stenotrophomonas sp. TaxID=165438 RepID=A0A1Y5PZQ7_9GAMM|nr:hypothetical protein STPYR_10370 [uncultured Stenotrophomonas sp.]